MSYETKFNLVSMIISSLIGAMALLGAVFAGAYWHYATALICLIFSIRFYTCRDSEEESVKSYFKNRRENGNRLR